MPSQEQKTNLEPSEASDTEMQAHLDEMSQRHAEESTSLSYMIEWLFKHQDSLPDGTTKEQVGKMNQYKQIELLERINADPSLLGNSHVQHHEVVNLVESIDKKGYRTADYY